MSQSIVGSLEQHFKVFRESYGELEYYKRYYKRRDYEFDFDGAKSINEARNVITQISVLELGPEYHPEALAFLFGLIANWQEPSFVKTASKENQNPEPVMYAACDKLIEIMGEEKAQKILYIIYRKAETSVREGLLEYDMTRLDGKMKEFWDKIEKEEAERLSILAQTTTAVVRAFSKDVVVPEGKNGSAPRRTFGQVVGEVKRVILKEQEPLDKGYEHLSPQFQQRSFHASLFRRYGITESMSPGEIRDQLVNQGALVKTAREWAEASRSKTGEEINYELQTIHELIDRGNEATPLNLALVRYDTVHPKVKPSARGASIAAPGGIDLNAKNMEMDLAKEGKGVEMKLDPAMLAEFQQGNFTGVKGVILSIVAIQNPLAMLGLETNATSPFHK